MMLTDRNRVELAIIPNILLAVCLEGANRDDPETQECERLLASAALEPIVGLREQDQRKLLRRIVRLHDEVMGSYRRDGSLVAKSGLIAYYLLQAVTESDYLHVVDGSDLHQALGIMLPALEPAANLDPLDASAQKAARKVLVDLQKRGYFQGVEETQT